MTPSLWRFGLVWQSVCSLLLLSPFLVHGADPIGAAELRVMAEVDHVQRSNFGANAFRITNTGDKAIAAVTIDVTRALYPDVVFDPEGLAGDSVAKPLRIDTPGGTGVVQPDGIDARTYLGEGGAAGYRKLRLSFDPAVDSGFNPGESVGFSVDMDPNSIAGTKKGPLDAGAVPRWDVGGVSGAELIGSSFTVVFADGSEATGQLHGTGTQAGSHGLASEGLPGHSVELQVGPWKPGNAEPPVVTISGPAGLTARVILTRGFIQPVDPYAPFLERQLKALADEPFPANNAVDFQTVDVLLTGEPQVIGDRFDGSPPAGLEPLSEVMRAQALAYDPAALPVGWIAAVIDPETHLPLGPVTPAIYRH
jgi:hypothetical protein